MGGSVIQQRTLELERIERFDPRRGRDVSQADQHAARVVAAVGVARAGRQDVGLDRDHDLPLSLALTIASAIS